MLVIGLEIEQAGDAAELVELGLGQLVRRGFENGGGIGHRVIEPAPVELVAEIVVAADVALRAGPGVGLRDMGEARFQSRPGVAGQRFRRLVEIDRAVMQHGGQFRRIPFAVEIGFSKAQRPAEDQPAQRPPMADMDGCRGPFMATALFDRRPIRSGNLDRPMLGCPQQRGQHAAMERGADLLHTPSLMTDSAGSSTRPWPPRAVTTQNDSVSWLERKAKRKGAWCLLLGSRAGSATFCRRGCADSLASLL